MSRPPEDTGSNTLEDARRYEEWRARHYDEADEAIGSPRGRIRARGCRCHSASEEPCDYCSQEIPSPEREEDGLTHCDGPPWKRRAKPARHMGRDSEPINEPKAGEREAGDDAANGLQ